MANLLATTVPADQSKRKANINELTTQDTSTILGQLNEEDHSAERPFRSPLVVNAETGMAGESFFRSLADLRFSGAEVTAERKRELWIVERDVVVSFWSGHRL